MKYVLTAIIIVITIGIAWWFLSPLFIDTVVEEEPAVQIDDQVNSSENTVNETDDTNDTTEQIESPGTNALNIETESGAQEVQPSSRIEQNTAIKAGTESPAAEPTQPTQPQSEPAVPTSRIIQGNFAGQGSYRASGQVFINGQDLSLVNLDSTAVPDGFLYLSNDLNANNAVRIAKLKGNQGTQNYSLPDGVSADSYKYVLIWCRAFSSLIGVAKI